MSGALDEALVRADQLVAVMARLTARLSPRPQMVGGATPLSHLAGALARAVYVPDLPVLASQGRLGQAALGWLGQEDSALVGGGGRVPFDLPAIFTWVASGRFAIWIGPAQIDRCGNTNNSRIGGGERPHPALVGSRGLPDDSVSLPAGLYYTTQHGPRSVVAQVDFVSGVGDRSRLPEASRAAGRPAFLVTDLGVFDFAGPDGTCRLRAVMPGVSRADVEGQTPFALALGPEVGEAPPPTAAERAALTELDPLGVRAIECVRDGAVLTALRTHLAEAEEARLGPRARAFAAALGLAQVVP